MGGEGVCEITNWSVVPSCNDDSVHRHCEPRHEAKQSVTKRNELTKRRDCVNE